MDDGIFEAAVRARPSFPVVWPKPRHDAADVEGLLAASAFHRGAGVFRALASDGQGISWDSAGGAGSSWGSAGGTSSCGGLEDGLEANRAIYGIIVGIHF